MRASSSPTWKERLPGAATALAVQAGLLALLVHSFPSPERKPEAQREQILFLPRLAPRPPAPIIDARQPTRAPAAAAPLSAPAAPVPLPPPAYTQPPSGAPALLGALGRALACQPDAKGRASPLVSCRGLGTAPGQAAALVPAPAVPVTREAELAAELARVRSERIPCTSLEINNLGFGLEEQSVHVDLKCLLKELQQ